jgi:hypothetical protein
MIYTPTCAYFAHLGSNVYHLSITMHLQPAKTCNEPYLQDPYYMQTAPIVADFTHHSLNTPYKSTNQIVAITGANQDMSNFTIEATLYTSGTLSGCSCTP